MSPEAVLVKKLVYGGYGLAEDKNRTLFIEYALPGELVEVEKLKEKKDYTIAKIKRVILPSSERRDPPCPYYGSCGGCQLQHASYGLQIRAKEEILLETIRRIGKVEVKGLDGSIYGEEFGYRVKVQFKVSGGKLGFFERKSHRLVEIEECLVAHPAINGLIPALKELSKRVKGLKEIHVLYSPSDDEFLIKLLSEEPMGREKFKKLMDDVLPVNVCGVGFYYMGQKVYLKGRDFTFFLIGPYRYRVSMDSFIQVNYMLWERFVKGAVPEDRYRKVLELHCGIGFFSLFLSEKSEHVQAYDSNRSAIKDAEYNARLNKVANVSFGHLTSQEALKKHGGDIFDLIFLDPPRSGLSSGEAKLILANKPKDIVYVSCEPSTLARDLKVLVKGGYRLKSLLMVDNFPNTYHIEAIAKLSLE